jgi:trehalose-phosphatase
LGKSFANVITLDLENCLNKHNISIMNCKGYVEVKPKGINKGEFASFILREEILNKKSPDFILTIGNDSSDEEMFIFFKKKRKQILNYLNVN